MNTMLYHTEIFVPPSLKAQLPKGRINLTYSKHAKQAGQTDRYGTITRLPQSIDVSKGYVFEFQKQGSTLVKFAVRFSLHQGIDITFVIAIDDCLGYIVKTLWLNKSDDVHKSLDRSKYVCC